MCDIGQVPAPGLHVERTLEPSGHWFREVCGWLRRPVRAPGTTGWPLILIPDVIDCRFRVPGDAVLIYHRVEWSEGIPPEVFDVGAAIEWISVRGRSVELGMSSRAIVGGRDVARSLLVVRAEGQAEAFGQRDVPAAPKVGPVVRHDSFVVTEEQVRTFAALAGAHHRLHDDALYAQKLGFPTVLVQGVVLLLNQLHVAGSVPDGRVEMWFKRPVPAGSIVEICRSEEDPELWVLRLAASPEASAIGRLVAGQ